jgi:hypothetical protein
MNVVVEEADESVLRIELLIEAEIIKADRLSALLTEAKEILAIVSKAQKTAKSNRP